MVYMWISLCDGEKKLYIPDCLQIAGVPACCTRALSILKIYLIHRHPCPLEESWAPSTISESE